MEAVATVVRGVTFDKSEARDAPIDGTVPVLRAGNISDVLDTGSDLIWVPSERVKAEQLLRSGDIAICMSSGSQSVVGKSAPLRGHWTGSVGAFCAIVRPRSERVDSDYLALYMRSERFRRWTRKSEGANIKNIRHSELLQHQVPLPSLPEQRRIVDLLSRAENIVRMRRDADQKSKEIIPALFLDMFGDPARNERGWAVKPLAELVRLVSGGTPSKSRADYWQGSLPWISPKDMKAPEISNAEDHVSDRVPVETSIKLIPVGAVLIVVRGMILVHTAPVAITRVPVTINQDMKALIAGAEISGDYLMWLLRISQQWLLSLVTTAAHGTRKIDTGRLVALQIPVPPKELQERLVQRITMLIGVAANQSHAKKQAERTLHSLLASVFREDRQQ